MDKDKMVTAAYEWMNEIKVCRTHRTPEEFVNDLIVDDMAEQYIESETEHIDKLTTECFLPK